MQKRKFILALLIILIGIPIGIFGFRTLSEKINPASPQQFVKKFSGKNNPFNQRYSAGKCEGEGTTTFTHSPIKIEDIGRIEPYGIMIDAHVIPTSHGYISPIVFNSPRDAYPVFAIADGVIVNVSHRGDNLLAIALKIE